MLEINPAVKPKQNLVVIHLRLLNYAQIPQTNAVDKITVFGGYKSLPIKTRINARTNPVVKIKHFLVVISICL